MIVLIVRRRADRDRRRGAARPAAAGRPGGRRARAVGADVRLRWLAGKALAALLTLVFVLVFNFFLFRVMGDPTAQLARLPRATPGGDRRSCAHYYGLDKPLLGQFADYAGDTVHARPRHQPALAPHGGGRDRRGAAVDAAAGRRRARCWPRVLGTWLGVIAATRRGTRTDDGLLGFSLFTYAAPGVLDRDHPDPPLRGRDPDLPGRPADDAGGGVRLVVRAGARRRRAPRAAGHRADADAARPVLRDHALVDGRRPHRGLHHRQARDRAAVEPRGAQARGAERAAAARDAVGDPVRRRSSAA